MQTMKLTLKTLQLPSFAGTNSLFHDINMNITNIFKTPLIQPASSCKAIYTALMRAQGISVWSCGVAAKTIVLLDLDLYKKCYLLVHSREDMQEKYIIRLGELHTVFAHVLAIGTFIASSGLEEAWLECNWFDGDCVVQQVLECRHMKRALEAHEASMITVQIIQLLEMVKLYPEMVAHLDILNSIRKARVAIKNKTDTRDYYYAFVEFATVTKNVNLAEKWKKFEDSKERNSFSLVFTQEWSSGCWHLSKRHKHGIGFNISPLHKI